MKFYELRKGQAFRFQATPYQVYWSAGVDGAYGRYVTEAEKLRDSGWWHYCKPLDEVLPE